ncbi:hypothetical protein [Acinetobacter venetianus]|uniref:hypothetical protein n=1 Tax=Acinetobacter venetianus TaxID=52133 RepID=UPI001023D04C|nr:hypothetical protein [Acinetobacter venetianus]RZG84405.1 hypothetical protein EXE23_07610 [Acinetobacter venetianus]
MSITVYLQVDQDIDQALYFLNQKHYHLQATRWYKKRYGYFEKPSLLKHKRKKMKAILSYRNHSLSLLTHISPKNTSWLKIEKEHQFALTDKNAMGY